MVASTDFLFFFSSRRNRPFQNAALCTGNGTLMGNPTRRMANANCRTPNATCTLRNLSYATQIVVRDLTRTLRNSSYATQLDSIGRRHHEQTRQLRPVPRASSSFKKFPREIYATWHFRFDAQRLEKFDAIFFIGHFRSNETS